MSIFTNEAYFKKGDKKVTDKFSNDYSNEADDDEYCEDEDCSLVCKKCGYEQYDEETVKCFKERFPNMYSYDIPYYCGACQDTANDEEYESMQKEMEGERVKEKIV